MYHFNKTYINISNSRLKIIFYLLKCSTLSAEYNEIPYLQRYTKLKSFDNFPPRGSKMTWTRQ